jgi:hypothetical protein
VSYWLVSLNKEELMLGKLKTHGVLHGDNLVSFTLLMETLVVCATCLLILLLDFCSFSSLEINIFFSIFF